MVTQIHVLRNLITNVLLTVNAMVDGNYPRRPEEFHGLASR